MFKFVAQYDDDSNLIFQFHLLLCWFFQGFVYGIGRGLLGTITKPIGGFLDLVSGAMITLSEAARPSSQGRPLRRRPRRGGLSKLINQSLNIYSIDQAVANLQLNHLNLFVSIRNMYISDSVQSNSTLRLVYSSGKFIEIGDEDVRTSEQVRRNEIDDEKLDYWSLTSMNSSNNLTKNYISYMLSISSNLNYLFLNSTETVFDVLPCQFGGVVALITDHAVWCVRDICLQDWIQSKHDHLINESVSYFY